MPFLLSFDWQYLVVNNFYNIETRFKEKMKCEPKNLFPLFWDIPLSVNPTNYQIDPRNGENCDSLYSLLGVRTRRGDRQLMVLDEYIVFYRKLIV